MPERYVHGFYSPDVFCTLVLRTSRIPMDDHDRKVIYRDMLDSLVGFLEGLEIGQAYNVDVVFHTKVSKLHVLRKQYPEFSSNENMVVTTGRLHGIVERLDTELFTYNRLVAYGDKPDMV